MQRRVAHRQHPGHDDGMAEPNTDPRDLSTPEARYRAATGHDLPPRTEESEQELAAFLARADQLAREFYGHQAA